MEINKKSHNQIRLQGITFIVLFSAIIGLLAWVSYIYNYDADWTANNRNTLSEATTRLLENIDGEVKISVFIPEGNLMSNRVYIEELVKRYQRHKDNITLTFINPDTAPELVRELKITSYGEVVVEYQGRNEHIKNFNEKNLTNTLQRLLRQGDRKLLFLTGHGERGADSQANFGWLNFVLKLKDKGIQAESFSLNNTPTIPADVSALVIASPEVDFLPGEIKIIREYIKRGGNLLWASEPVSGSALTNLDRLAEVFGISFHPGTIVDPTTQMLNVSDPTFSLVTSYPPHAITRNFQYMSIYPRARGIAHDKVKEGWDGKAFLQTVNRAWAETSPLKGVIDYNEGEDIVGPLTIGLTLTRKMPGLNSDKSHPDKNNTDKSSTENAQAEKTQLNKTQQRIVILGDGDFISNAYLGNQGNLNIGMNIINWLTHDDAFIAIPEATSPDTQLNISNLMGALIALMFLVVLPLTMIILGVTIWLKRRKR